MNSETKPKNNPVLLALLVAIFCLLALLLLNLVLRNSPRHKAEANALWSDDASKLMAVTYNQLKSYCQSQTNFPALTAQELHQRGIFDDRIMAFLKSPKVHFYPFSSDDPDTNVVLSVVGIWPDIKIGNREWNGAMVPEQITKRDILSTNPPARWLDLKSYR